MRTESKKPATGKIISCAIVALVVAGAVAIFGVAEVPGQSSLMSKAFIFFLGAVIVLQVVPGIMLLGAMAKGVASLFGKKEQAPAADKK